MNSKHLFSRNKSSSILYLALFFAIFILYKYSTNIPNTLTIDYTSINEIPWSDAVSWVEGAENIKRGEYMPEFPSRRPIYPALLSVLFFLTGNTYIAAIFSQIFLFSLAALFCFYVLEDIKEKYALALFLSCLALWLPKTQSLFLTENLGSITLIVSFCLLWKGLRTRSSLQFSIGLFFLSLSFFVRPWAVGCLLTLPFLAFSGNGTRKEKFFSFSVFLAAIVAGYLINSLATLLFATPETASNYPQTLYGLVTRSLSWRSASTDEVISGYMQSGVSPQELNKIIYQRCLHIFLETPSLYFSSVLETYKRYFLNLNSAFHDKWFLYLLFFSLFLVLAQADIKNVRRTSFIFIAASVLLIILHKTQLIFLILLISGLSFLIVNIRSNIGCFGIIYLVGILISLPIVGIDGGNRVKIASDIYLFFLLSLGAQHIISPEKEMMAPGFQKTRQSYSSLFFIIIFSLLLLVVIPWSLKFTGQQNPLSFPKQTVFSPEEIAELFNYKNPPLSTSDLDRINLEWPAPSFETLNGQKVLLPIYYTGRDAIFLPAEQSVEIRPFEFWPMRILTPPAARTIHTRTWCIFPGTEPFKLEAFDQQVIYILGTLIGQPRNWKYDTGYAVVAEYIGTLTQEGIIEWHLLQDIAGKQSILPENP